MQVAGLNKIISTSFFAAVGCSALCFVPQALATSYAAPCTLAWDSSPDPSVAGYALYYTEIGSDATNRLDVGLDDSVTLYTLTASADYLFYVVAYDQEGTESDPSNALEYSPPPLIISGLSDLTVIEGDDATFTTLVKGQPVFDVQWQKNGTNIDGATSASLTITNVQFSTDDQAVYSIIGSSLAGGVTNSARLTVIVRPLITLQPTSIVVTNTQPASFTVIADGVPTPTFQWLKDGIPIIGATSTTYSIAGASPLDVASYSVIVSNEAGTVTSSIATLTIPDLPPVFVPPIPNTNFDAEVGVLLSVTNVANVPGTQSHLLTFNLLAGPTNATLDSFTGIFTWRPLVTQADAANSIIVQAIDTEWPNLSATQNFTVTVHPFAVPEMTVPVFTNGEFSFSINGQTGPDYAVQVSTNLLDWMTVLATNSPILPFNWTDPDTNAYSMRFYRIVVGFP